MVARAASLIGVQLGIVIQAKRLRHQMGFSHKPCVCLMSADSSDNPVLTSVACSVSSRAIFLQKKTVFNKYFGLRGEHESSMNRIFHIFTHSVTEETRAN